MVNIATIVAPVNIAFSSSRNAASIERKVLRYTTLSKRLHHRTLNEIKTQVFTLSDVPDCALRGSNNTQTRTFQQNLSILRCQHVLT